MNCPRCASESVVKNGKVQTRKRGKKIQRFLCQSCNKNFTRRNFLPEYREKKPELNKKIKRLYVEGTTIRGMSRILDCGYNTSVRKFIKYSLLEMQKNAIIRASNKHKANIIQLDEMHTYLGQKHNTLFVALAVSGYGSDLPPFYSSTTRLDPLC